MEYLFAIILSSLPSFAYPRRYCVWEWMRVRVKFNLFINIFHFDFYAPKHTSRSTLERSWRVWEKIGNSRKMKLLQNTFFHSFIHFAPVIMVFVKRKFIHRKVWKGILSLLLIKGAHILIKLESSLVLTPEIKYKQNLPFSIYVQILWKKHRTFSTYLLH
jgi:hypothetical protein